MARTDSSIVRRQFIFDMYASLTDSDVPDLSDALMRDIMSATNNKFKPILIATDRVRAMIADPAKSCPFIDEIAMERAMRFDWPVIENLSDTEWAEFYRRLGKMADPLGTMADPELKRISDKGSVERPFSERAAAWARGGRSARARITEGIVRVA